jgi:hypothetical protein
MIQTKAQKSGSWTPQIQKKAPSLAPPPIVVQRDAVAAPTTETSLPEYTPLEPNALQNHPLMGNISDLPPIQTKLTIGAPGDRYEQEADTIARKVVSQINSPTAQAKPATKVLQPQPVGRDITVSPFAGIMQAKEAIGGNHLLVIQRQGDDEIVRIKDDVFNQIMKWLYDKGARQKQYFLVEGFRDDLTRTEQESVIIKVCDTIPQTLEEAKKSFKPLSGRLLGSGDLDWDKFGVALREVKKLKTPGTQGNFADTLKEGGKSAAKALGVGIALDKHKQTGERIAGGADAISIGTAAKSLAGVVGAAGMGVDIGSGAIDIAVGGYRAYNAHQNQQKAAQVEQNLTANQQTRDIASYVRKDQELERTKGAIDAVKGAGIVAASIALLATGVFGLPIVAIVGGLITAAKLIYASKKKNQNKQNMVDNMLNITEMPEGTHKNSTRNKLLHKLGFASVDQCFNEFADTSGAYLHQEGVIDRNPDGIKVIESMSLKVDHQNKKPSANKIAKTIKG